MKVCLENETDLFIYIWSNKPPLICVGSNIICSKSKKASVTC